MQVHEISGCSLPHKAWATNTMGASAGILLVLLLPLNQSMANTPPSGAVNSWRLYFALMNHFLRTATIAHNLFS